MALTAAGFIATAVEAAEAVSGAHRRHAFEQAVRHFEQLLATVPDHAAGDFADADIEHIRTLAEAVIELVEQRASEEEDRPKTAQELVGAVYAIRSRLEQIDIWRRHFRTTH
jgi:hypothetical protein